jgi:nucleotide-binding universal stress UspA family protein
MSSLPIPHGPASYSIKTILLATDFHGSSSIALECAMAFASHYGARLLIVHAFELTRAAMEAELLGHAQSVSRKDRQSRLEAVAAKAQRAGITADVQLVEGEPAHAIGNAVKQYAADLLVLGTHGIHRGLSHLLIGSTTEALLQSTPCPALTVGTHVLGGVKLNLEIKKILYMSDFTREAAAAAPYAVLLGQEFGSPVDVCHLLPDSANHDLGVQKQLTSAYYEAIKRIFPGAGDDWGMSAYHLERSGALAQQILNRAKEDEAGLIVLGLKTESHLGQHLHGNIVYEILAEAVCPIITIRADSLYGMEATTRT